MAEQSRFSPETFLAVVHQQLKGLEAREQLEILQELRDHLEDAAKGFAGVGHSWDTALEKAAVELGDPSEVGNRLRREHLARRLPVRYGLLAAVPFLAFILYTEVWPIVVYFIVPRGQNPGALIFGMQLLCFVALLGLSLWGWRRGHPFAAASFLGLVGAYAITMVNGRLVDLWRLTPMPALLAPMFPPPNNLRLDAAGATWLGVGSWVTLALLFLPVLILLVRWGRLQGRLVILGGIAVVTAYHWVDSPMGWLKLLAYLAISFGPVALVVAPRRFQTLTTWVVLAGNFAILALGRWYFIVYEAPHAMNAQWRAAHPPTLEVVLSGMPYSVLAFAAALLLSSQLVASAGARYPGPRVQLRT